jgi:hypothetical protein
VNCGNLREELDEAVDRLTPLAPSVHQVWGRSLDGQQRLSREILGVDLVQTGELVPGQDHPDTLQLNRRRRNHAGWSNGHGAPHDVHVTIQQAPVRSQQ